MSRLPSWGREKKRKKEEERRKGSFISIMVVVEAKNHEANCAIEQIFYIINFVAFYVQNESFDGIHYERCPKSCTMFLYKSQIKENDIFKEGS